MPHVKACVQSLHMAHKFTFGALGNALVGCASAGAPSCPAHPSPQPSLARTRSCASLVMPGQVTLPLLHCYLGAALIPGLLLLLFCRRRAGCAKTFQACSRVHLAW